MIGVYAIRNTKNGKMYIGESIDIEKRWGKPPRRFRQWKSSQL